MSAWEKLWEGINWDRITTIPFITERIHKIKAEGDRLLEKAEKHDEVKAELDRFTLDVDRELDKLEEIAKICKKSKGETGWWVCVKIEEILEDERRRDSASKLTSGNEQRKER